MATSTLTSKGQITIPKSVRDRLGLHTGDVVELAFDERGWVVLSPRAGSTVARVSGVLRHLAPRQPVSIEEMRRAVLRRAAAKRGSPSTPTSSCGWPSRTMRRSSTRCTG